MLVVRQVTAIRGRAGREMQDHQVIDQAPATCLSNRHLCRVLNSTLSRPGMTASTPIRSSVWPRKSNYTLLAHGRSYPLRFRIEDKVHAWTFARISFSFASHPQLSPHLVCLTQLLQY